MSGNSVNVTFLTLNWLHELHDLSFSWLNHTENVPYPPNVLPWLDTTPPMLKEDFCCLYTNVKYTDIEYSDDNSLEASQDDDKDDIR